jgi:hypothetical protein
MPSLLSECTECEKLQENITTLILNLFDSSQMDEKQKKDYFEAFRGLINHLEEHKKEKESPYKILRNVAIGFLVIGPVYIGLYNELSNANLKDFFNSLAIGGLIFIIGLVLLIVYGFLRTRARR